MTNEIASNEIIARDGMELWSALREWRHILARRFRWSYSQSNAVAERHSLFCFRRTANLPPLARRMRIMARAAGETTD